MEPFYIFMPVREKKKKKRRREKKVRLFACQSRLGHHTDYNSGQNATGFFGVTKNPVLIINPNTLFIGLIEKPVFKYQNRFSRVNP